MTDRCPQCNAEYGPDDAYCPVCGTPRRGNSERDEATGSDSAATWPGRPAGAAAESEPNEDDDFIPLVIPPEPRGSWATGGGRHSLAAIAIGLVALGLLAAGAWLVFANGDDDDGDALDRPDVPAWVATGSPGVATPPEADRAVETPASDGVAHDNGSAVMRTATPTPPTIAPPDGGSRAPSMGLSTPAEPGRPLPGAGVSPAAGSSSNASFAATPTTEATPTLSPTTPPTATATPLPTITPTATATATPSPTKAPTTTARETSIPANAFPNTVAAVLESIVARIEPPATEVAPIEPAPATTSPPVPAGDGTGGAPPT